MKPLSPALWDSALIRKSVMSDCDDAGNAMTLRPYQRTSPQGQGLRWPTKHRNPRQTILGLDQFPRKKEAAVPARAHQYPTDPLMFERHVSAITTMALQSRLPGMYLWRMYSEAGGLMSCSVSATDVEVRELIFLWRECRHRVGTGAAPQKGSIPLFILVALNPRRLQDRTGESGVFCVHSTEKSSVLFAPFGSSVVA